MVLKELHAQDKNLENEPNVLKILEIPINKVVKEACTEKADTTSFASNEPRKRFLKT